MAFTLTQTLSYQTKQYLEEAYNEQDAFKTHVIGRFQLLGTALVGTLEIVVRLALFILGQVAGLFSLYRSPEINQFLQEQIQAGFSACILTSANFFSLLSPNVFRTAQILQAQEERVEAEPPMPSLQPAAQVLAQPVREEAVIVAAEPMRVEEAPLPREEGAASVSRRNSVNRVFDLGEPRIVRDIIDCVMLPFQMIAFFFKLPFYIAYLTFHIFVVLPIRFVLLPLEVFLDALSLNNEPEQPREPFRLNLI